MPPIARLPHRLLAPPPRITSMRSIASLGICPQSRMRKYGSLIGMPSTITSVLMLVVVPKPRRLKACPVGWIWSAGTCGEKTPGILFSICSTVVSGARSICWRVTTVVLMSMSSRRAPRPAVTVTAGISCSASSAACKAGVSARHSTPSADRCFLLFIPAPGLPHARRRFVGRAGLCRRAIEDGMRRIAARQTVAGGAGQGQGQGALSDAAGEGLRSVMCAAVPAAGYAFGLGLGGGRSTRMGATLLR